MKRAWLVVAWLLVFMVGAELAPPCAVTAAGRTPFLVLAGDFLSPSVASSVFKGAQMIAALNAAGLDMATLGNHEFDFGDDVLITRMHEAKWQWVVSNVVDTATGKPIADAAPYVLRTFGGVKVGFIGLCLNTSEIAPDKLTHTRIVDPLEVAARYLPLLKQEGANEHREPHADQQSRHRRALGGAHRRQPPSGRHARAVLRAAADHERDSG